MPRSPCLFRETDVRRAVKATRSSGLEVGRIEITQDGRIVVFPCEPAEANDHDNPWDEVLTDEAHKKRSA
jgi:hypothetical protein